MDANFLKKRKYFSIVFNYGLNSIYLIYELNQLLKMNGPLINVG